LRFESRIISTEITESRLMPIVYHSDTLFFGGLIKFRYVSHICVHAHAQNAHMHRVRHCDTFHISQVRRSTVKIGEHIQNCFNFRKTFPIRIFATNGLSSKISQD